MKKFIYGSLVACLALGMMTSCESHDYDEVSKAHQYGENENPPIKGTDANMVTEYGSLQQGTSDVVTVNLADYADQVNAQMGITLDECISGLSNGSTRFLMANPSRRVWDKSAGTAGENSWYLNAQGTVCGEDNAVAKFTFNPSSKSIDVQLTDKATGGVVQMMSGFVKTDDSAYPTNFRLLLALTVTDASVIKVNVSIEPGDYTGYQIPMADYETNIAYGLGMSLGEFATALINDGLEAYMMRTDGTLYGGPDSYTANGQGYWLTENSDIINWGVEGFAYFIEPAPFDEAGAPDANGGYLNIGRLSSSIPASGTTIESNYVLRDAKDASKSVTFMLNIYFE